MKKFALLLAAVVAVAGFSTTASAVPVNVTFQITDTLGLGALVPNPGVGGGGGTMTLQFTGTETFSHISSGPVHLVSLNMTQNLSFTIAAVGGMLITGALNVTAPQSATGTVTSLGHLNLGPTGGAAYATGTIHCSGAFCTNTLVGLPPSIPIPLVTTIPFFIASGQVGGLSGTASATINWTGTFLSFAGIPVTGIFSGTEVSRNAIPEPNTFSLVAFGALGLAGVARRYRRR